MLEERIRIFKFGEFLNFKIENMVNLPNKRGSAYGLFSPNVNFIQACDVLRKQNRCASRKQTENPAVKNECMCDDDVFLSLASAT